MSHTHSANFLANIPIGVYQLNAEDKIIYVNQAWLDMFGFKSLNDVVDHNISLIYMYPQEAKQFRKRIQKEGSVKDALFEFKRTNGEHIWVSAYSTIIRGEHGEYAGREGIIHNVTERQAHRKIAEMLPAGYYIVEKTNGMERVITCNQEFAEMFGFATRKDAIGFDIRKLYFDQKDYEQFSNRITHSKENSLRRRRTKLKTVKGKIFDAETNINIQRDRNGNIISRIGVVRDLSTDQPLQKLRKDFGNVSHSFTTGFIAVKSDMDIAIEALGPNPFEKAPEIPTEILLKELQKPKYELQRKLAALVDALSSRNLASQFCEKYQDYLEQFDEVEKSNPVFQARALRDIAVNVADTCVNALATHNVPRQPHKEARYAAYQVMRIFALARLQERVSDVLQMEHELRSLRAYITSPSNSVFQPKEKLKFWPLVEKAINNLHDFADSKGVEFKIKSRLFQAFVLVDERNMLRVITNLIHNAIKYSWSRQSGTTWIDIGLYAQNQQLILEIENYGVPIPQDEIKSNLIFEFGFRSRLSSDRGRVGTGIGLADARETIERYGGSIELISRAASPGGQAENRDPFLTKAIVMLPIAK